MACLSRFLNPKTIAVIGGKECERVIEQCDKLGFTGTIWPIHPSRETMGGRKCFRTVEELPEPPDASYVAVNRERSVEIVKALSKLGAGGAVCYAAGFAEADGESAGSADLQTQLVLAAGDMPIIGPNCYGFINALEGVALWPDQHGAVACERGVAIITQSSNVAINLTMQKRGLPIATMMTVGNQAQIGMSEIGLGLIEDDRITVLGMYVEGLDDVTQFERLALRARELGKPIVVLKVGKSEQARATTMTHTASLAGSNVAHTALFKRLGIARVESLEVLLETLKLFHAVGVLDGGDLLSLSCSGGEASLMADAAEGKAVTYRPFTNGEISTLKKELGEIVTVANPLDYNTFIWGDWLAMERMFCSVLQPNFDLSLLVMDFPRNERCDDADWQSALDSFIAAHAKSNVRCAVVSSLPETMPEAVAERLLETGIAPLCGFESAIQAAEAAAMIGAVWRENLPEPLLEITDSNEGDCAALDEHEAKQELALAGLIVPKGGAFSKSSEIEPLAEALSPPYALKALGVAHKTETGGVVLNLETQQDIVEAMHKMANLSSRFLLEEMATTPLIELIVGITRDPICGLLMTIGAGGVLAELLDDSASLLLPTTEAEIRNALASAKVGKLLDGFRGTDAADIDALIANIICIANYAESNKDTLEELDVNPLFVNQFGSVAVDALIVKRKTHE
ncbi:MAG: acetate--CoA ligase family protein [Rhizobiaceae bacterium]